MARRTAADIARKQVRNAQQSSEEYVKGVNATTVAPGAAAVAKKTKLVNGFLAAINSGKWEENTAAVTLDEWKRRTASVGGRNYSQGVADSQDKVEAFWDEFLPFVESVRASVNSMPDDTEAQRDAKMLANANELRKFRRTRRARR